MSRRFVAAIASAVLGLVALQGAALAQGAAPPLGAGQGDGAGLVGAQVNPVSKLTNGVPAVGGPTG
jgi:hypothetical protein